MKLGRRGISLLLCFMMVLSLFAGIPVIPTVDLTTEAEAVDSNTNTDGTSEWVTAWHTSMMFLNGNSESGVSTAVDTLAMMRQRNFRTQIQLTMAGDTIRLTYSNEYSTDDELLIGEITLAEGTEDPDVWADGSADKFVAITNQFDSTETKHLVRLEAAFADAIAAGDAELKDDYYGNHCIAIKPGKTVTTNAIDVSSLDLHALDYLSVTTWTNNMMDFDEGFTGGLIGGVTRYLGSAGLGNIFDANANYSEAEDLYAEAEFLAPVTLSSSDDSGDYNIIPFLSTIEFQRSSIDGVTNTADAYTTVIFGDSTVANDIPTLLAQNLISNDIDGVAVTWAAVKGNELLLNGQSSAQALEEALAPEDETGTSDKNGTIMDEAGIQVIDEVLALSGVKKVIVKLGINDILHPYCNNLETNYNHKTTAAEIIAGYKYLIDKCHDAGVEIYFYELTPWYGYTRDNAISWNDSIDAVRREVNSWLATYGKAYDEYKTLGRDTNTDSYSGTVTIGNNYGSSSGEQYYDNLYSKVTATVNNSDSFDTFGYISLESLGTGSTASLNGNSFKLQLNSGYTTDGIHFTKAGQLKLVKLTPESIFVDTEAYAATAGSEVNIDGLMFRTTSLASGNEYVICNTNGVVNTDAGRGNNTDITIYNNTTYNQSITGYAVSNTKTEHADGDAVYNADISGQAIAEKTSLGVADITVQCGESQIGYVVEGGLPATTIWTLQGEENTYVWNNDGWYLAWYWYGSWDGDRVFPTSVINHAPMTSGDDSLESISNEDWYSFDVVEDKGNGMVNLYYESMTGANKNLVFFNKNMDKYWQRKSWSISYELKSSGTNYGPQFAASLQSGTTLYDAGERVGVYCDTYDLALFSTQTSSVKASLDLTGSGIDTTTDKTVFNGKAANSTLQLNFMLNSQLTDKSGVVTGTSYTDTPANNEAKGPFDLYTFGDNQKIFWMSTDTSVATVSQSTTSDYNYYSGGGNVTFTGAGGTTDIVANYLWSEYDGTTYVFDNNNNSFYTTAQKDAYIAAGTKTHSSTENGYHWIEITNNTWVWTNYHWLQTTTELTNIGDFDVDITLDNDYGKDNAFTITDVAVGDTADLTAIEITDPVGVDYVGDHWAWTSSNTSVATISGEIDQSAVLNFTGTSGTTIITVTRVDASGNAVTDPADGQVIKSTITVTAEAKLPDIDIFVADGTNPDRYDVDGVAIGDTISLTAKVTSTDVAYTVKSWSWTLHNSTNITSTDYYSISQSSSATASPNTANLTVKQEGPAVVDVTLTLSTGKTVTSRIIVNSTYGVPLTQNTVIDYGLKVDTGIDAAGVSTKAPSVALVSGKTTANEYGTTADTSFGTASISSSGTLVYTPTKIATGTDKIYYSMQDSGGRYRYSDLNIVPATSVYYEDNISSITYTNGKVNGADATKESNGLWVTKGSTDYTSTYTQSALNSLYGYDSSYANNTTSKYYSMGQSMYVRVSAKNNPNTKYSGTTNPGAWPTASFTFTGTGFDVISRVSISGGTVRVNVKSNTEGVDYNKNFVVDTYHGYTALTTDTDNPYMKYTWEYLGDGWGWHVKHVGTEANNYGVPVADMTLAEGETTTMPSNPKLGDEFVTFESNVKWEAATSGENLYQSPVMKVMDLTYASYTVTITPIYSSALDQSGSNNYFTFFLDAIRIYGASEDQGLDVYKEAKEAYPQYINLRNVLIDTESYSGITESGVAGVALIDGKSDSVTVEDYEDYGALNELYLSPGQAITFKLETSKAVESVQLGMKAYTDGSSTVKATITGGNGKSISKSFKTNTDLYYDITSVGNVITISNTGTTGLSLTNLKVTFAEPGATVTLKVYAEQVAQARVAARMAYLTAVAGVSEEEVFLPDLSVDAPETVTVGSSFPVTVTTSDDVAYITVNGEKVTENDNFVWTYTATAAEVGDMNFTVKAYNADGEESELTAEATVAVETKPVFNPTISLDAATTATVGDDILVTVTTSDDVAYITVNGEKITENEDFVWTVTLKAESEGDMNIVVVAYNANGEAAENSVTATVTVTADAEEEQSVLQKFFDAIKRFFKSLFGSN